MPLVDYGSSDEESDEEVQNNEVKLNKTSICENSESVNNVNNSTSSNISSNSNESLFSALPKPRNNLSLIMDDSLLSSLAFNKKVVVNKNKKSEKEVVQISVPSISDFNDDDDDKPQSKKPKLISKNAGLLSVLPPPKNVNNNLIPKSISQIKKSQSDNSRVINKFLKKPKFSLSESSNNVEMISDKSLNNETPTNYMIENQFETQENVFSSPLPSADTYYPQNVEEDPNSFVPSAEDNEESIPENELGLDEKALQILCGGKKKRQQIPMNIIDLSGEQIMPDSKEWLLKQLSEEKKVHLLNKEGNIK
ncbi:conserved hypothetical protein [Pediculus humanus corporis]|uniref:Uncharacterized protein n=1 Tax=Pediculus humanus subsp. corporis TaxID=121224 RepID=E0VMP8_PEDHC|nr:uncharacterized protein Phum_PHUM317170 [Pediculus humanus corporis]EEB14654.1 conserved hypothetical protein [Pediculus humanus corporis]